MIEIFPRDCHYCKCATCWDDEDNVWCAREQEDVVNTYNKAKECIAFDYDPEFPKY